MQTWLYVGSSPELPTTYAAAIRFADRYDFTITTNRGIRWMRTPDYVFWFIQDGPPVLIELAIESRDRGTKLVALAGSDLPADIEIPRADCKPHRGGYSKFKTSGVSCLEFACMQGASRIVLAGATGYPNSFVQYFDGGPMLGANKHKSGNDRLSTATTDLCKAWHDVEFICMGTPRYKVDAPNWVVMSDE